MRRAEKGLSRRVVAGLVGRSEEWLRLVESGRCRLDSVEVILALSEVLGFDHNILIERRAGASGDGNTMGGEVARKLRQAILGHPRFRVQDTSALSLDLLSVATELASCRRAWHESPRRYTTVLEKLPAVVSASRLLYLHVNDSANASLQVSAYHLAREVCTGIGADDLAWIVADRAMELAGLADSPIEVATAAWHFGCSLLHIGETGLCLECVASSATLVDAVPNSVDRTIVSGAFHLLGARASAAEHDLADAERRLAGAKRIADELGRDGRIPGVTFGQTEIDIACMEISTGSDDADGAVKIGAETELTPDYPVEGRARYYIAMAEAFATGGDDVGAVFSLTKAAAACPEELRFNRAAHRALQRIGCGNQLVAHEVTRLFALAGLERPRSP